MVLEDATCQGSQEMDAFKWGQTAPGTVPTPVAQWLRPIVRLFAGVSGVRLLKRSYRPMRVS